jgi:cell division protein FtsQ
MNAKKIILFIFWLAVFVGVVFVLVRAGAVRDKIPCEKYTIQVKVTHAADTLFYPADIEEIILKHDSITGKPYNEIDLFMLEAILRENPYISDLLIFGDLPGTLQIMATQRTPVVRIINKHNESFYLDETAHAMPARLGISANVITVSGNIEMTCAQALSDTLNHEWDALLSCVKYISNDDFLKNQIGQIWVENEHSYLLIPVIGNHKIILGTPEEPENRLERLKIFYQKGMDEEAWETYKSIDLRYRNQIVCKK